MTTHGFELVKDQQITELNTRARLYRHAKTGAQLLSMENNDENKVFGISFFTPPTDTTGVAHILEHSVLCGSRKYPLKEPFVELIKGSLNTFVNAMTFNDKTCYPIASQNLQDFYNLVDVYLDTVFYPLLKPQVLQQEGWHYELNSLDEPMIFKGVVFNEMKGAYSSPDELLSEYSRASLFPDTTYGVDSGGDPKVIPNLTYPQFKSFHQTYYHPSNALVFFYGDDDPDERLRLVDAYLKDFDTIQIDKAVKRQPPFDAPRRLKYGYDASAGDDGRQKGMVTVNWALTDSTEIETHLGLDILAYILTGTPASPLRKALIDSGLGEGLAGVGLDDQILQMYFSTGLKGIAPEDSAKVETLILDTLAHLAKEGIDPATVEAALNTIEFRLRENNTGRFPRGLALMINALSAWLYGGDPISMAAFEAPLNAIKARVAGGEKYFEGLIKTCLLDNTHRTTITLEPDPTLREREDAAERERLDKARAVMSQADLLRVIEETKALKVAQETPDSPEILAMLPTLSLADLDKQNKLIPITIKEADGSVIYYHDLFTNGIVYLDFGFNLRMLPQELLPYVPLFSRTLLEMGTEKEDFVALSQRIGRKTGGIGRETFNSLVKRSTSATSWLLLRGKCTLAQVDDLLSILHDVLTTVRLDNRERFRQILLEDKARREASLIPGGPNYVYTRIRAGLHEAGWVDEQLGGVSYIFFLRELAEKIEKDWPAVLANLESVRRTLLNRNAMICNATLDGPTWAKIEPTVLNFLGGLPAVPPTMPAWKPILNTANEGLAMPAQVNYVGKGADLYKLGYRLHGSIDVILNYVRTTWLWERVRVQGGAYGGGGFFNQQTGDFAYLSWRDPNLTGTLDIYDATAKYLRDLDLSDSELTRSIIGAIGDLDTYLLPDAKGMRSLRDHLVGETDAERQRFRDEMLSTTAVDFRAFAEALDEFNQVGIVKVLGSSEHISTANAQRGNFLQTVKVL